MRYNPDLVRLGGVLAPPYDVIAPAQQEALYARNMRNVVRVELGIDYDDDVAGERDRYTRAREHIASWLKLGVLVRDAQPSYYVNAHQFAAPSGDSLTRRGVLGLVPAVPWEHSELRPHERTLAAPKEDRLALLRATRMQTSPVFVMAAGTAGLAEVLSAAAQPPALLGGRTDGELGPEKHLLWRCDAAGRRQAIAEALAGARLYVADGHHRYETLVAYAEENREAPAAERSDPDVARCLVYVSHAGDPALLILPTHRLVRPAPGVAFSLDDLWARLDDSFDVEPMPHMEHAIARAAELRATHHAFSAVAHDGIAVLSRLRRAYASPRASLDVSVLEEDVLGPAGVSAFAISEGALEYTRDATSLVDTVHRREAVLGFAVNPVSTAEVMAVADARETMPQKSTYFYPKVPTGLVLNPL